ncbi:MAG: Glyoxalase/Bleomycin resistance protein/Dioxygenase superfamily [Solirubrobacteraceae bacterium]|nr:Glyoxalase/Bleomycin resistance protein/Dioxygenase superfamily [Solirubrobacteraceae bacterium]
MTGLQHVTIECAAADCSALLRFWAALGFTEVAPPPSLADRAAWVQAGATQVHLLWTDAPRTAGHVAVQVDDHDAAVAALHADGFHVEPRTQHWGAPRSYATAPGGHTVELFDQPPAGENPAVNTNRAR